MIRMEMIYIEDCCEILDFLRVPITASERKEGKYPYYGANGIQDLLLIIFLMMNLYYWLKMVVILVLRKDLSHIEFLENVGLIIMHMY